MVEAHVLVHALSQNVVNHGNSTDSSHGLSKRLFYLFGFGLSGLNSKKAGHCLQIVFDSVVDLPDSCVFAYKFSVSNSQLSHVATKHNRAVSFPLTHQRNRAKRYGLTLKINVTSPSALAGQDQRQTLINLVEAGR